MRADRSIPKRIKDEADYYAKEDAQQINKLKSKLEEKEPEKKSQKEFTFGARERLSDAAAADYSKYPLVKEYISKSRDKNNGNGYKSLEELKKDFGDLEITEIERQFKAAKREQLSLRGRIDQLEVLDNDKKEDFIRELKHLKELQSHAYNTTNNQLTDFLKLQSIKQDTPEPAISGAPKTTVEIEVGANMEMEKKTNLGQIKNKIAANSLRFSRGAYTALYSKKTPEGHAEFKEELSHTLTDLGAITEEINDSQFQKEEFVANKNGTPNSGAKEQEK